MVFIELRHDGVSGYGEAAPIDRYEETADSALRLRPGGRGAARGRPVRARGDRGAAPRAPRRAGGEGGDRRGAARSLREARRPAGLAAARARARRAADARGRSGWGIPTTWLSGRSACAGRFKRLKLKIGGGDGLDVERVRAVRGVSDVPLQVDVNEAWSLDEALEALPQLAELGVEYCEQPLPAGDPGGPELKSRSPLPIYVDEDLPHPRRRPACAERAHGLTVKLAKSGGIREAVRMAHAGRALGLGLMLGCMNESGLGGLGGRAGGEPLRPRRPRREPAPRRRPVAGRRARGRGATPLRDPGLGVREAVPDPR